MRDPKEQRIKKNKSAKKEWSITDGDYERSSLPDEETYKTFNKKEKSKKMYFSVFLILSGLVSLILILEQLTEI